MAEAAASVSPWIPKDDVLLKKSVEDGASLLALAKGAVTFSRKFTLQELRDRWHSLLFDPDVSEKASFHMAGFEHLASNLSSTSKKIGNSKVHSKVLEKRKVKNIHSLYYTTRKKQNIEISNSTILCSPLVLNKHVCIADISGFPQCEQLDPKPSSKKSTLGHGISDHFGPHETNYCIPHRACPQIRRDFSNTIPIYVGEDNPSNKMTNNNGLFDFPTDYSHQPLQETIGNETRHSFDRSILEKGQQNDRLNSSNATSKCDYLYLSDSLLNIENEEHTFMEIGLKNVMDNDDKADELPIVGECNSLTSKKVVKPLEFSGDACSGELHCLDIPESAPDQISQSSELYGVFMHCRLNTEDPNIPDNDDIIFSLELKTPFPSPMKSNSMNSRDHGSPSTNRKESGQGHGFMLKRRYPAKPFRESKLVGLNSFSTTSLACIVSEVNSANAGLTVVPKHYEGINSQSTVTKREEYSSALDSHDPSSVLAEHEIDGDIPYFSDVESMVLDMDLDPCPPDSYNSMRVAKNHSEYSNTKMRKVMRFEQCGNSSLQRDIVSRGAFAILYGYHLKYYIKKAEITLGRATDDNDVDVDLSREGRANKISRRQAVMKLQRDGSLCLKNVGRGSVFVNDKEALTGQLLKLNPSCLIQIRGLNFVLEVNGKAAKEYVASVGKEIGVRSKNK